MNRRYCPGPPRGLNHAWNRMNFSSVQASFRFGRSTGYPGEQPLSFHVSVGSEKPSHLVPRGPLDRS